MQPRSPKMPTRSHNQPSLPSRYSCQQSKPACQIDTRDQHTPLSYPFYASHSHAHTQRFPRSLLMHLHIPPLSKRLLARTITTYNKNNTIA